MAFKLRNDGRLIMHGIYMLVLISTTLTLTTFVRLTVLDLGFPFRSSVSAVRDKLVPDMGVLRQRLGESYEHFVQSVSHSLTTMLEILPTWGDDSAGQKKAATSST